MDQKGATSPTMSLESVLITATIDVYKGQDVAVVEISRSFMSVYMDDEVIMTL